MWTALVLLLLAGFYLYQKRKRRQTAAQVVRISAGGFLSGVVVGYLINRHKGRNDETQ
jgi:hypothetical protein